MNFHTKVINTAASNQVNTYVWYICTCTALSCHPTSHKQVVVLSSTPPTHDIIALRASFDALSILVMTLVTLVLYANKLVLLILFYRLGVIS